MEKVALTELVNRDDLIISIRDKGGATKIHDIGSYIQEATRQLEDSIFYNPTLDCDTKINTVTDNFKKENLITEKTVNLLKIETP